MGKDKERICRNCGKDLPESKFRRIADSRYKDGYRLSVICVDCQGEGLTGGNNYSSLETDGTKLCIHCRQRLPLDRFGSTEDKRFKRGYRYSDICKECEAKVKKERKQKSYDELKHENPEKRRRRQLRYGKTQKGRERRQRYENDPEVKERRRKYKQEWYRRKQQEKKQKEKK